MAKIDLTLEEHAQLTAIHKKAGNQAVWLSVKSGLLLFGISAVNVVIAVMHLVPQGFTFALAFLAGILVSQYYAANAAVIQKEGNEAIQVILAGRLHKEDDASH